MKNYVISYAQNREDVILDAFFPGYSEGFYVDVGANHPERDSVTKLFYDKGWRGINVEPTKRLFDLLQTERPHDINLNLGLADKDGELVFREYEGIGDGLSTFSKEMQKTYSTTTSPMTPFTQDYRDYKVKVTSLAKVLAGHAVKKINFLKVDVEGYEYAVLEGNDWEKYRPEVICIEANHVDRDWHPLLARVKYDKVFYDGLNEYFVDSRHPEISKRFSYLDGLVGRPIISADAGRELFRQESLNKKLEADRLGLRRRLNEQEKQIFQLHQTMESQQRVKYQAAALARSIDAAMLRRINKLDKPRVANGKRLVPPKLPANKTSKHQLLQLAAANDIDNFYATKPAQQPGWRHFFFIIVLQGYNAMRKSAIIVLKTLLKVIRRLKRRPA